jgi:tRNA threonylcarbamoyladenosine biosynthesis protein TsaE
VNDYFSRSHEDTFQLGERLSKLLTEGDVVFISGPLGVGKTVLVKGIAHGLGVTDNDVLSPSFTLLRSYDGLLMLHHMDLYRIKKPHETLDLVAMAEEGILVVEWPEHGMGFLPNPRWHLIMSFAGSGDRRVVFERVPLEAEALEDGNS